jgi:hypothetical protein
VKGGNTHGCGSEAASLSGQALAIMKRGFTLTGENEGLSLIMIATRFCKYRDSHKQKRPLDRAKGDEKWKIHTLRRR